jgi:hypothetical protein
MYFKYLFTWNIDCKNYNERRYHEHYVNIITKVCFENVETEFKMTYVSYNSVEQTYIFCQLYATDVNIHNLLLLPYLLIVYNIIWIKNIFKVRVFNWSDPTQIRIYMLLLAYFGNYNHSIILYHNQWRALVRHRHQT